MVFTLTIPCLQGSFSVFGSGALNGLMASCGAGMIWQIISGITNSLIILFCENSYPGISDFLVALICGTLSGILAGVLNTGANRHINYLMKNFGKKISKSIFKTGFGKTLLKGMTYVFKNSKAIIKRFVISYIIPNVRIFIASKITVFFNKR